MLRGLFVVCIAALTSACMTTSDPLKFAKKDALQPITPTEQFTVKVTQGPDEIMLAPHPEGVSDRQEQALSQLVARWRNSGASVLTIRAPANGAEAIYRSTAAIQAALQARGVRPEQIELSSYDAGAATDAPIAVGFLGYHAQGPDCGQVWKDYTQTGDNRVSSNFGCAVTANVAAMVANPGDLLAPRAMESSDAQRRETIIGKYHQGVISSTPADPQANGAISGTIQ
jgi:pilus assembly protein CpaD